MLLLGKPVAAKLAQETQTYIQEQGLEGCYLAIFLLSDDKASQVYVELKAKKAKKVGLYADIMLGKDRSVEEVLEEIHRVNTDKQCVGIIVQLPIAEHLQPEQMHILSAIAPSKDLDGLGGELFGRGGFGAIDFIPATPKAVFEILNYYELDDVYGKTVTVIGQSNLIGKPLVTELMKREATVFSVNKDTDKELLRYNMAQSDYIMSATGVRHLINKDTLSESLSNKILVDIGRGVKDGKAYGDIDREYFQDKVRAITPVPGGVGPVTVASLFHNMKVIGEQKDLIG